MPITVVADSSGSVTPPTDPTTPGGIETPAGLASEIAAPTIQEPVADRAATAAVATEQLANTDTSTTPWISVGVALLARGILGLSGRHHPTTPRHRLEGCADERLGSAMLEGGENFAGHRQSGAMETPTQPQESKHLTSQ
ncbi:hypothetical protein [Leifsonia aquatica]|uniref:hypothetical protein n=1 Tax=Leifsonia aquatica TaxID=144185 RepID=UPI0037FA96F6